MNHLVSILTFGLASSNSLERSNNQRSPLLLIFHGKICIRVKKRIGLRTLRVALMSLTRFGDNRGEQLNRSPRFISNVSDLIDLLNDGVKNLLLVRIIPRLMCEF